MLNPSLKKSNSYKYEAVFLTGLVQRAGVGFLPDNQSYLNRGDDNHEVRRNTGNAVEQIWGQARKMTL